MTKLFLKYKNMFLDGNSLAFALTFSFGHVCIAAMVVFAITGATIFESGLVALVEPSINAVWLYILHKIWYNHNKR